MSHVRSGSAIRFTLASASARRGVALLVVLMMIVGMMGVATRISRSSMASVRVAALIDAECTADAILLEVEVLLQEWLRNEAAGVVLSPTSDAPSTTILDDAFRIGAVPARIRVVATDLHGMPGSDWQRHRGAERGGRAVLINISTVPLAAVRSLGLPDESKWIDAVIESRRIGARPMIPAVERSVSMSLDSGGVLGRVMGGVDASGEGVPLRFTNTSPAWGFTIEITVGKLTKRWWAAYAQSIGTWECTERELLAG